VAEAREPFSIDLLGLDIGQRRVNRLKEYYEKKGKLCLENAIFFTGVDLIVISRKTGKVLEVLEVTNYNNRREWINEMKMDRYIASLGLFDQLPRVRKTLIVSYKENVAGYEERLRQSGITVRALGKQD
jgi:hypothetical protein